MYDLGVTVYAIAKLLKPDWKGMRMLYEQDTLSEAITMDACMCMRMNGPKRKGVQEADMGVDVEPV